MKQLCAKCNTSIDQSLFKKNHNSKTGYATWCKDCSDEKIQERKTIKPDITCLNKSSETSEVRVCKQCLLLKNRIIKFNKTSAVCLDCLSIQRKREYANRLKTKRETDIHNYLHS